MEASASIHNFQAAYLMLRHSVLIEPIGRPD
jgi:hypothetical protein